MDNIFIENQIDAVIHFAGFKAVSESGAKFLEYHENNMNSTFVLVDVMRFYGCKNIILSSSASLLAFSLSCSAKSISVFL